ncbi:MAG TPA: 4Fe-4S binding protein [Candidatus Cloacimonadota bacterium]|nr:4Fe-4S binding protein [Candidatus Cloacimonadota bacterium]
MKKLILIIIFAAFLFLAGCDKVENPQFHVDETSCNECGRCTQVCPLDAIEYGENGKAVIDQTKCNQCGKCITICPQDAIY